MTERLAQAATLPPPCCVPRSRGGCSTYHATFPSTRSTPDCAPITPATPFPNRKRVERSTGSSRTARAAIPTTSSQGFRSTGRGQTVLRRAAVKRKRLGRTKDGRSRRRKPSPRRVRRAVQSVVHQSAAHVLRSAADVLASSSLSLHL